MGSDTALVQMLAGQLLDYNLGAHRAAELAVELRQLHDAVNSAAHVLQFDDEPAAFVTLLEKAAP